MGVDGVPLAELERPRGEFWLFGQTDVQNCNQASKPQEFRARQLHGANDPISRTCGIWVQALK
jgi:hypothetical protein